MKKAFILAAAALMALVGCNKPEKFEAAGGSEVRFTSSFENVYAVKSASIDGNVRIVAGAPISTSVDATASGTALTPAEKVYWKAEQTEKTTFVGIYPSNGETGFEIANYNVVPNEGSQFPYMESVLTAVAKDVTPGSVVNLNFTHPFVKIVVNVDNQLTGAPEINSIVVKDVDITGNLLLDKGTVTSPVKGNVTATKNGEKYELIILPMEAAKPVIVVTVGTKAYTFKINTATDFVAGKSYTASLTLKDNTPVIVNGDEVAFAFTVTDWVAADAPLAVTDITEQWSVIGTVNGSNWDEDFPMTENASGLLEASITYQANDVFKLRKALDWTVQAGMKANVGAVGDTNWDGFLDGNSATNRDIEFDAAGVYTITFNPETYAFTATKTGDVVAPNPTTGKLTFNVYNAAGWESITFYGWEEADPWPKFAGEWPGTAPAATDVVVAGNAFKSFVLDAVPLNNDNLFYLLYGGSDSNKTINLKLPVVLTAAETTVFVVLNSDKSVEVISDPASFTPPAAPAGDVWVLVGLASDWNTEHEMTAVTTEEGAWTITVTLGAEAAESGGFKFRKKGKSFDEGQFGMATGASNVIDYANLTDGYVQLVADDPGSQNIVLTPYANVYTLKLYVSGANKGKLFITKP